MKVIHARPGDPGTLLILTDDRTTRVYQLAIGRPGKLSAQLQEIKTPQKEAVLRDLNQRSA